MFVKSRPDYTSTRSQSFPVGRLAGKGFVNTAADAMANTPGRAAPTNPASCALHNDPAGSEGAKKTP